MRIRRLEQQEHEQTKELYKQVFDEDSWEFISYYYTWKTRDNVIYAAEDEGGIHAMVQLNPFLVSVEGEIQRLHYIVAVATQKEYRHQGLMRRLLCLAEQEMAQRGEQFTFLMPASEKIYFPFGYRFFAWQRKGILRADALPDDLAGPENAGSRRIRALQPRVSLPQGQKFPGAVCRPAEPQEYAALALFVNDILGRQYDVFVYRDTAYYERLCAEQRCQGGEVMVIVRSRAAGKDPGRTTENRGMERTTENRYTERTTENRGTEIIGTFCTAKEDRKEYGVEIREIIFAEDMEAEASGALQEYVNSCGGCRVAGCQAPIGLEQEKREPLLMGKIPGGDAFSSPWKSERVFINEVV